MLDLGGAIGSTSGSAAGSSASVGQTALCHQECGLGQVHSPAAQASERSLTGKRQQQPMAAPELNAPTSTAMRHSALQLAMSVCAPRLPMPSQLCSRAGRRCRSGRATGPRGLVHPVFLSPKCCRACRAGLGGAAGAAGAAAGPRGAAARARGLRQWRGWGFGECFSRAQDSEFGALCTSLPIYLRFCVCMLQHAALQLQAHKYLPIEYYRWRSAQSVCSLASPCSQAWVERMLQLPACRHNICRSSATQRYKAAFSLHAHKGSIMLPADPEARK
jgi:hypothetical protein